MTGTEASGLNSDSESLRDRVRERASGEPERASGSPAESQAETPGPTRTIKP